MTPNIEAFLSMLSHSEGTDKVTEPYRCCFGFKHTTADLTYHPSEARPGGNPEWMGESLAFLGPAYTGKVSTAAGRYQLIHPTWQDIKSVLHLPDFTGPSQDDAAIFLIQRQGALRMVDEGLVEAAIALCHPIWASLPGSTSGQPQASLSTLLQAFVFGGGVIA